MRRFCTEQISSPWQQRNRNRLHRVSWRGISCRASVDAKICRPCPSRRGQLCAKMIEGRVFAPSPAPAQLRAPSRHTLHVAASRGSADDSRHTVVRRHAAMICSSSTGSVTSSAARLARREAVHGSARWRRSRPLRAVRADARRGAGRRDGEQRRNFASATMSSSAAFAREDVQRSAPRAKPTNFEIGTVRAMRAARGGAWCRR